MKKLMKYICLALIYCNIVLGGYLITAPNRLIPDRNESVCVSLHNLNSTQPIKVTIKLSSFVPSSYYYGPTPAKSKSKTLLTVSETLLPSENNKTCVKVIANSAQLGPGEEIKLKITCRQKSTSYRFNSSRILSVFWHGANLVSFIQTDKAIYKPGQTVKFRVLNVDSTLRPLHENIAEVVVETPSRTRVSQWKNVSTHKGLGDFKLQLSDEPELGEWTIKATTRNKTEEINFKVAEYVLPKFEVTINPPKFVALVTPHITVQVCAKYTYGEPVKGTVHLTTCVKDLSRNWNPSIYGRRIDNSRDELLCHLSEMELATGVGCASANMTREQLGYDRMEYFFGGSRIDYSAYVVEKGTGVILNATDTQTIFAESEIELTMEGRQHRKPGIPYTAKVKAAYLDKAVAAGKNISITVEHKKEKYVKYGSSDKNGDVWFTIPTIAENMDEFRVFTEAVDYEKDQLGNGRPIARLPLPVWYSPSGQYLQFVPLEEKLKCNSVAELKLFYTTNKQENVSLYIVMVGPGDIINSTQQFVTLNPMIMIEMNKSFETWEKSPNDLYWGGANYYGRYSDRDSSNETERASVADYYGNFTISVPVTAAMFPKASVLVYYVTSDGEVISDEIGVEVETCTANKVSMQFDKVRGQPDDDVTMSLRASPYSLCAYGVVDKSVHIQGGDNQLTQQTLTNLVTTYSLSASTRAYQPDTHCQKKAIPYRSAIRGKRSIYPSISSEGLSDAKEAFNSAGVVVMTDLTLETRPCPQRDHYAIASLMRNEPVDSPVAVRRLGAGPSRALPQLTVRDHFPETWLWDMVDTNDQGVTQVDSKLPHTITEWVGSTICIHEIDGLGVSESASVTSYQSFFVSATLPYSAIRGETIPIALTVFNYLETCLPVQVRLKSSTDYTVDGPSTVNTCVCSKDSTTNDFFIVLNKIGLVNLTITATILSNEENTCEYNTTVDSSLLGVRDAIIKPLIVEPEGAPREYTVSEFICQQAPDEVETTEMEFPLPNSQLLVPDSVRSTVSTIGDVMGNTLANVDNLLKMPYGCGEQNMVGFSPNVFVLQYLEGTNRDSDAVRQKAITHMESGYQRELRYRHADGSYSAFGPGKEEGSIWLTAFVVKCFAQATPFIYIDPIIQQKSINFFERKQLPNGCFPQVGLVHSKYMQGGIGKRRDGTAALTAYILISMLEAGVNNSNPTVMKAIDCLSIQPIADNYTLSLVTYAFSLYDRTLPLTSLLYNQLLSSAINDSMTTSWKVTSEQKRDDGTWWHRPKSADVEATSYALLAILQMNTEPNNMVTAGLPVVKWLSQQRNAYGGFGSTQDTVIGLQALAQFASLIYSDDLDVGIAIRFRDSLFPFIVFRVDTENSLVQRTTELTEVAPIVVSSTGSGCYLLQGNVKYNVYADLLRRTAFSISIDDFASDVSNNACKQRKLHICIKYESRGTSTNMAVAQVRMVSGWAADPASLKLLLANKKLGLKMYDVEKNNDVQMYFDQITSSQSCFNIEIMKVMNVKNTKPAVVTVYDYYQKELSSDAEYDILSAFCPETPPPPTNTKEDLPTIDVEEYENSISQARQPSPVRPPWLDLSMESEEIPSEKCPMCYSNSTSDFDEVASKICGYKNAYKVFWRAKQNNSLSLMADLRHTPKKKKFNKVMIKYALPQSCPCSTLFTAGKGDKLLFVGNWDDDVGEGSVLQVTADSAVFPLSKAIEKEVNKIARKCRG